MEIRLLPNHFKSTADFFCFIKKNLIYSLFSLSKQKRLLVKYCSAVALLLLTLFNVNKSYGQLACASDQRLKKTTLIFQPANNTQLAVSSINQDGWVGAGSGTVYVLSGSTFFHYPDVTQTLTQALTNVNLKGTGATISITIKPSNSIPLDRSSSIDILYNGNLIGTIDNPNSTSNGSQAVTVTPGPGITRISAATIPVGSFSTVTFQLPANIANNGNLQLRFNSRVK